MTRVKRESPLDLSVKTVRQSADSTANDSEQYLHEMRLLYNKGYHHNNTQFPDNTHQQVTSHY